MFCEAMGSYCRGKPETGDVDILIAPHPSRRSPEPSTILNELLELLRGSEFLTTDLQRYCPL